MVHPALPLALFTAASVLLIATASGQPGKAEDFIVPTREAFLRCLDLTDPGFAAVKEALDEGDVEKATAAYIAHFRAKPIDSPLIHDWAGTSRNSKYNTARADGLLEGHFWDGYSVYEVPETGLDWHGSPLSCVTRFPILGTVRWALHHTQDTRYSRFAVDHILEYMGAYSIEEFIDKRTSQGWTNHTTVDKPWYWCMIPERLSELSETMALIKARPEVTDEELIAILHRLYQETGYLRTDIKSWVDRRHNGGGAMIGAMAQACAILDDFPAAHEWQAYDAQLAAQYLDEAFYPDGMCVELTVAYSSSVASLGQRMAYALRQEEAIASRRDKLEAIVTCLVALSDPTGWLPSFGDLYAGVLRSYVNQPLATSLDMPWAVAAAASKEGPLPPFTQWPVAGQDQWCGYYTMRSGWTPDAAYMAIDAGPWGTTHRHGDRLSFVVTAEGARFIIDPSSTRYASNEPDAMIGGQPSGFLHNTITVDGVDEFCSEGTVTEVHEPLQNTWEHGPRHSLFAGSYSFKPVKPVTWQRRVVFADGSYWLLQDVLTGSLQEAELEQNFQFEVDTEIEFEGDVTLATAPNGSHLALVPLSGGLTPTLTIGDKTPHTTYWPSGKPTTVLRSEDGHDQKHGRGWTGRGGSRLVPAPAVTYVGKSAFPAIITVAIVPLSPGQTLNDLPTIQSQQADGSTTWLLPLSEGMLEFVESPESCRVVLK